ncbi:MAG: hypothetical protein ACETVZ_03625 [Phycisphaerae bacterium]
MDMYSTSTMLPLQLQSLLDEELNKGEELRWWCQPSVSRAIIKSLSLVVFAVIWLAISVPIAFAMYKSTQEGEDVPTMVMVMIGIFLLIGLWLLTSPFWAARKARNTVYAITHSRAIILRKGFSINIQSFSPEKLTDIIKRIRSDGSGDLIFERHISYHHSSKGGTKRKVTEVGFFGIPRVNEVEDILRELRG